MYAQDSFFDLSPLGQVGLACLSTVLFAVTALAARSLFKGRPLWIILPGALCLFWLFDWLAPQIYYMYYRILIPGLPLQWVIWPPPGLAEIAGLVTFQGPQSLSAHSRGLLAWSLVLVGWLGRAKTRT